MVVEVNLCLCLLGAWVLGEGCCSTPYTDRCNTFLHVPPRPDRRRERKAADGARVGRRTTAWWRIHTRCGSRRGAVLNRVGRRAHRRSGSYADGSGACLLIVLIALAVAWPWFAGAWLAERFLHATDPSFTRSVVAWGCEALYVAGIASLFVAARRRRNRREAEATARLWEWVAQSRFRPPFPAGRGGSIDDYEEVELMALAVWVQSTIPELDRPQQLGEMRKYLGFSRMGSRMRPALERAWDSGDDYLARLGDPGGGNL